VYSCSCSEEITGKKETKMFLLFNFQEQNYNTTYTITESSSVNKAVHAPLHMRTELNYSIWSSSGILPI
jgi:hypothetical protein